MPSGITLPSNYLNPRQPLQKTTTMAKRGMDTRDLRQLLSLEFCSKSRNYIIYNDGKLEKRPGMSLVFDEGGTDPITMLKKWTSNLYAFGYGTTLSSWNLTTEAVTDHKTDFTTGITEAVRYGEYLLTCNGIAGDKIYITPSSTLTPAEIAAAPKAATIAAIGPRFYAGNTDNDTTEVHSAELDDGTDPPFSNWTVGTGATDPFKIFYRTAGGVKAISSLGQQIFVLYEDGRAAFTTRVIDVGGVQQLDTPVSFQQIDFGGFRGAVTTPVGVFYVNEGGVWQLTSIGQTNTPLSENLSEVSALLNREDIDDISFSNADIAYDLKRNLIYITCALDSSTNNLVLVYNLTTKGWSFFTGWSISRFMTDGSRIFGGDATKAAVYELMVGADDNENDIYHEYEQELQINGFDRLSQAAKILVQAQVSASSDIKVKFDIYDRNGKLVTDKIKLQFPTTGAGSGAAGVGSGHISYPGIGSLGTGSGLTTILAHTKDDMVIPEFWRIILKISGSDKVPHIINIAALEALDRQEQIELNNFTVL